MRTKKKKLSANKSKSRSVKIQQSFKKFKNIVESKLGRVNWKQVGFYTIAILLVVATKGLLGPEAKIVAHTIVKFATYA